MHKYQKYKGVNRPYGQLGTITHSFLAGRNKISQPLPPSQPPSDQMFSQFQEGRSNTGMDVLSRARKITHSNRGKIDKMRKEIKKLQEPEETDFMTGVGLYEEEKLPQMGEVDDDQLMRNLRSTEYDDLAELRRMIKSTQKNLRDYSQSVFEIQSEVVNAADKYGKQLDTGLAIKINRCNLKNTLTDSKPQKTPQFSGKKRAMSSQISKRRGL